ncbi:MAG: DeoR/GlpR transcriptional regulator [Actinobacteria bacterium]|nr:DeoR/GlpR transcriptional regulator [Actinomycetota bacterium]
MSLSGNLATEHRLVWIRERLDNRGQVRIADAASHLDVSEMTIRRDLQELEAQGVARRVRGGAVAVGPLAFADRHKTRARAKAKIAAKLIEMVPSTGAVGIDASSTLLRLATSIENTRDLIVLTNGWETFHALQGKAGVTPMLTGGQLDSRTGSLVGPIAYRAAGSLLMSRLFISAAAVDLEFGPSEPCLEEAEVKRALAGVSSEVVLAVDSSKLAARSVARSMPWEDIDMIVTELDAADPRLDEYRDLVDIR